MSSMLTGNFLGTAKIKTIQKKEEEEEKQIDSSESDLIELVNLKAFTFT